MIGRLNVGRFASPWRSFGLSLLLCCLACATLFSGVQARERFVQTDAVVLETVLRAELPPEARATLALIESAGPYPYERDGSVFGNYEKRLPPRSRGYYREYTVTTPGVKHRGARRIVAGTSREYFYTDNHYRSFRKVQE